MTRQSALLAMVDTNRSVQIQLDLEKYYEKNISVVDTSAMYIIV